jgi:two-component system sensor histidine kinase KdpD
MRERLVGVLAAVGAVAVVSALIALLESHVPVLSLGVLYVFAVLPIAVRFGTPLALLVCVASMLAFNWFFLEPRHTFTISDARNWFALAVYVVTAIVVSQLAASARHRAAAAEQRERESTLVARLATELLRGRDLDEQLDEVAGGVADVLGVRGAQLGVGPPQRPPSWSAAYPLEVDGRGVGMLYLPSDADPSLAVRQRFLPALAALLGVALDRDRLEREALEAEALRRSDLVKTALLRATSHDLRTPLTGIRAAIGALRSEELALTDEDRAELLETIDIEAERLARIVGDLLDLSRLEAGHAAPERGLWHLQDLVAETVARLGSRDRVSIEGEQPIVEVDAAQVERVLANLLENALTFSPPREAVQVRITATRNDAVVRVVDHGPGVPDQDLDRIFEPFFRREGVGRPGAGLGLAIARGFAEANGGRVWAESRPGQGATFALALPLADVPAEARS